MHSSNIIYAFPLESKVMRLKNGRVLSAPVARDYYKSFILRHCLNTLEHTFVNIWRLSGQFLSKIMTRMQSGIRKYATVIRQGAILWEKMNGKCAVKFSANSFRVWFDMFSIENRWLSWESFFNIFTKAALLFSVINYFDTSFATHFRIIF